MPHANLRGLAMVGSRSKMLFTSHSRWVAALFAICLVWGAVLTPSSSAAPAAETAPGHVHEEGTAVAETAPGHVHEEAAPAEAPNVKDPCKSNKLKHLPKSNTCTHGPDPAPPGLSIAKDVPPLTPSALTDPAITCIGDGVSGPRTQVLYVRASDVASRYATFLPSFRQWAADADTIYSASAAETGGARTIRFVHDANCVITVPEVVVSTTGDDTFDNTVLELQNAGFNSTDRKYMLFVDANVYCGIGGIWNDDRDTTGNANNVGPSYGRSDAGCWNGAVAAHEHMHNLGGVQLSAPHTSGGWHCVDEYDRMCYSDTPNFPTMQIICTDTAHDSRFDCNHEDYYSTSPPAGGYLDTHWNTADNQFLTGIAPVCPDASREPDDSAAQARAFTVGTTEGHAFCANNDQDWVKFTGSAGTTYRLETLNLASGSDTVIELYASNGTTLLASNDDSGGTFASLITYTPTTSGTLFLKVRNFSGTGSTGYTYDLRITGSAPPPTNLLVNPSFEIDANADTRPDSWTSNAKFTRSSTIKYVGTYSGRHLATDNSGHTITQTVSNLTAGATYAFSGRVNIPATSDAFTYKLQVRWLNSSNTALRTDTVKTYSAATSGWNLASASKVAPTGAVKAQIRLVVTNLNARIHVDDLVFRRA
jgi:hypothetical protein